MPGTRNTSPRRRGSRRGAAYTGPLTPAATTPTPYARPADAPEAVQCGDCGAWVDATDEGRPRRHAARGATVSVRAGRPACSSSGAAGRPYQQAEASDGLLLVDPQYAAAVGYVTVPQIAHAVGVHRDTIVTWLKDPAVAAPAPVGRLQVGAAPRLYERAEVVPWLRLMLTRKNGPRRRVDAAPKLG